MGKIVGLICLALCACGSESSTAGTENPLGVLVECDQVVEEVVGYNAEGYIVARRKVAYVPVEDPLSVTITRCGRYRGSNGGPLEPSSSFGVDCHASGEVTFTPDFDVYVECQEEEMVRGVPITTFGAERVYLRVNPKRMALPSENPLGAPVECDEVVEESTRDGDLVRRKVAYVPVADPTSVTVTRCGEYYAHDGETAWSRTDCDASRKARFTGDSHVVVECGEETIFSATGSVGTHGYEQLYLRANTDVAIRSSENPLGVLVECDEVVEWESSPDTVHATLNRLSVAYLPVADPTSVTITRCGEYETWRGESTYSDACVSSKEASFTEDFEVFVRCEEERTGWFSDTQGYGRIYLQVD